MGKKREHSKNTLHSKRGSTLLRKQERIVTEEAACAVDSLYGTITDELR